MSLKINPLSNSESWNAVAESYAELADWVMSPFAKKALEYVPLNHQSNVVDVACGTGILTCMLANHVQNVEALDFSPHMLKDLKDRLVKREITNVKTIEGDGQNLPYQNDTFDSAFSLFGLMFFPDRVKGFSELYRVLKPKGQAVVSSWAPLDTSTLMQATSEAIKAALPDAPSPRANSQTLENPEVLKKEMEEAGFSSVVIHTCSLDLPAITANMFWKLMSEGGAPIALLKKSHAPHEWDKINQDILNFLHAKYKDNLLTLSTTAYFGTGIKK